MSAEKLTKKDIATAVIISTVAAGAALLVKQALESNETILKEESLGSKILVIEGQEIFEINGQNMRHLGFAVPTFIGDGFYNEIWFDRSGNIMTEEMRQNINDLDTERRLYNTTIAPEGLQIAASVKAAFSDETGQVKEPLYFFFEILDENTEGIH